MADLFVGTDPGKTGATAALDEQGELLEVCPHRKGIGELLEFFDWVKFLHVDEGMDLHCALEKVHVTPQMGCKSAFTFGGYYYQALTLYETFAFPYEEVTPQFWQKELDCLTGGNKKVSQAKVEELIGVRVSQEQADSVLIAEWCRRQYT